MRCYGNSTRNSLAREDICAGVCVSERVLRVWSVYTNDDVEVFSGCDLPASKIPADRGGWAHATPDLAHE